MKKITINSELFKLLQERDKAFKERFGREPGPGDPVFFDPDGSEPRFRTEAQMKDICERICEAMEIVGINPAVIYAFRKTGRIVTSKNKNNLTRAELAEWKAAIKEYRVSELASEDRKASLGNGSAK